MVKSFLTCMLIICGWCVSAQSLESIREVEWTNAGLRDTTTAGFTTVNMNVLGAIGDGTTPNDSIVRQTLANHPSGVILHFPSGNFLFTQPIQISSNAVIKGNGAEETTLTFNLGGTGHSIHLQGNRLAADTSSFISNSEKGSSEILVNNAQNFSSGDWIQIIQNDIDLVTSSWAKNTIGQIVEIQSISRNKITLHSKLRLDYSMDRTPYIEKITPEENVGIECLKIVRLNDTAPEQSSNIYFQYAVNCWVNGIESENCTFSHIQANQSSNIHISKSYMHHAFDYGGGGRAYGVMLQATSNEIRVENNIFEHLRHSMIVQSGANGNVFAYNYSTDPYWSSNPSDAAGDMVLHGNYPYLNLFEHNICSNIVIDNSHGPNGPYNTIFRNRAEKYGIFFSANNSPFQNIIGNEITNKQVPYSLVNYLIQGSNHLLIGNNNKGSIHPTDSDTLMDLSFAYTSKPDFIPTSQWATFGTKGSSLNSTIPAHQRFITNQIHSGACGRASTVHVSKRTTAPWNINIYPNPVSDMLTVESPQYITQVCITNTLGQVIYHANNMGYYTTVATHMWTSGTYFVTFSFAQRTPITFKLIK